MLRCTRPTCSSNLPEAVKIEEGIPTKRWFVAECFVDENRVVVEDLNQLELRSFKCARCYSRVIEEGE